MIKSGYLDSPLFLRDLGREPIEIVRGEGAYLFDSSGKRYLDAASGAAVASLGHGNRELAELLATQAQRLAFAHPSKFATREALELAEKLVERSPPGLTRVLYASGGSEATETAIKLARQYHLARGKPGKYKVISRRTSYHGATLGALALSGQAGRRQPFAPMMLSQPMIAPTSCYRCPFGREPSSCDFECADDLETALGNEGPENVAAFIAEPVVGSSAPGRHPPDGYWTHPGDLRPQRHRLHRRRSHERQRSQRTLVGDAAHRRGPRHAHHRQGHQCRLLASGCRAGSWRVPPAMTETTGYFRHGHTFAGNPLSCAVGSRVIDIIERDGLLTRVTRLGELVKRGLEQVLGSHPLVGVIRGRGLLLGVEFVADRATRAPLPAELDFRTHFSQACLAEGVYVYQGGGNVDGRRGDHVLLAPPFIISDRQVTELTSAMGRALERVAADLAA